MSYITVFDALDFVRQFKTGDTLNALDRELTEAQFETIRDARIALYADGHPQYVFDAAATDGLPCADGFLRLATAAEILAWRTTPEAATGLPTIYATLEFSGGDGKDPIGMKLDHATKGTMSITGELRALPDVPGSLPVSITFQEPWRITIRKVVSEFDTSPTGSRSVDGISVVDNVISWTVDGEVAAFDPALLKLESGIYMITADDFAPVDGTPYGLSGSYRVELVGGDHFFKVLQ